MLVRYGRLHLAACGMMLRIVRLGCQNLRSDRGPGRNDGLLRRAEGGSAAEPAIRGRNRRLLIIEKLWIASEKRQ